MKRHNLLMVSVAALAMVIMLAHTLGLCAETENASAIKKLGRGTLNILFGWLEVIVQPGIAEKPSEVVLGFFKGFAFALGRTAAGFYDVVTFPVPMPANYAPIIQPETVFKN